MLRNKTIGCDFDGKKVDCNHLTLGSWKCFIPQGKKKGSPVISKWANSITLTPAAISGDTENSACKKFGKILSGKSWKGSKKRIDVGF